ncbi:kinase-like protein [Paxillus ammoniavirescens]|nr:kinase-like protein [Paxillus ammoniavirescens]
MSHQNGRPSSAAGGRSFIALICELLQTPQSEEALRANIISAAEQGGSVRVNGIVPPTFSRPPDNVTMYIREKGPYADDTSGGFSDVWKCVLDKPGEPRAPVAVKALRLNTKKTEILQKRGKDLRAEVHIWIRLDHPNVLKLHGIADGFAPLPALVSPWIERGTLTIYLEDAGPEISTATRISILVKVGNALHYIHSDPHHVVHGDLTGSNILINDNGEPLISDFGLSSILEEYNETSYFKSRRTAATRWVAPELLGEHKERPKPSIESDVYSYGCVMLHIPFLGIHDLGLYNAKIARNHPQRPTNSPIEDSYWQVIENCLDVTPGNRPELPDIISFLSREG